MHTADVWVIGWTQGCVGNWMDTGISTGVVHWLLLDGRGLECTRSHRNMRVLVPPQVAYLGATAIGVSWGRADMGMYTGTGAHAHMTAELYQQ